MALPSKNSKLYTPGQEALFPLSRSKVEQELDAKLMFRINLLPHDGYDSWVQDAVLDAERILNLDRAPEQKTECPLLHLRGEGVGSRLNSQFVLPPNALIRNFS
jgi:hypothetical protein